MIVLAIVLLLRELGGHTSRVALLDTAIVAVAIATVQWIFFVGAELDELLASARGWSTRRTRRWTSCC